MNELHKIVLSYDGTITIGTSQIDIYYKSKNMNHHLVFTLIDSLDRTAEAACKFIKCIFPPINLQYIEMSKLNDE